MNEKSSQTVHDSGVIREVVSRNEAVKELGLCDEQVAALATLAGQSDQWKDGPELAKLVHCLYPGRVERRPRAESEPSIGDAVSIDLLADRLSPWARIVRQELFRSPGIPFQTVTEMETWIKKEENEEKLGAYLGIDAVEWHEAIRHTVKAYRGSNSVSFPYAGGILHYIGEGGKKQHARIRSLLPSAPMGLRRAGVRPCRSEYSPLAWLKVEAAEMAKSSGLSEPSLVTFVLTGLKPVLRSRWTVGLAVNWSFLPSGTGAESDSKHGEVIASTYAEISIRAGDLSLKELKDIYHSIKRGLTAQKGLNKGHLELHRLVCQRGGMTAGKGAVAFWKSIMQEWNSTHGKKAQYRTWNGPRIAYGRLLKKLSAYGPSNLSDLNQWIDGTLTPEKSK